MSLFGGKRRGDPGPPEAPPRPPAEPVAPKPAPEPTVATPPAPRPAAPLRNAAHIGGSIAIEGDLRGDEDLVIDGRVVGQIELPSHELTIGADGDVRAEVRAKSVVVVGRLTGNVAATERVEVQSTGKLVGDVQAPRLAVREGARLQGAVETGDRAKAAASAPARAAAGTRSAAS